MKNLIFFLLTSALLFNPARSGIEDSLAKRPPNESPGINQLHTVVNPSAAPEVVFHEVKATYNVKKNGVSGMKIHINLNVNRLKGGSCKVLAYFYNKSGTALKDKNGKYKTVKDNVSSEAITLTPGYDKTWYKDLVIFMPYPELHVNGKHQLKYRLGVYHKGKFIGFSAYQSFNINWSNPPKPALCSIAFGGGGKTYTREYKLLPGQKAQWPSVKASDFVRKTSGPCYFILYNQENFKGRYVILGTKLNERIRVGEDGIRRKDKGGGETWKVRSIKMVRPKRTNCRIRMGGNGIRMTYYTGEYKRVPAMDRISEFSGGDGNAAIWNQPNFGADDKHNRFKYLHPCGLRSKAYDPGFRVRSIKIRDTNTPNCRISDRDRCLPYIGLKGNIKVKKGGNKDKDFDGLNDFLENKLAAAFRPVLVNHSSEDATRAGVYKDKFGKAVVEPVTIFQVHTYGADKDQIIIRYMFLWLWDRYNATFCGTHKGDSQSYSVILRKNGTSGSGDDKRYYWYVHETRGGVEDDLKWKKGNGSIRGIHFQRWKNEKGPGRHGVIYFSKGKHHQYADGGWSGQRDKDDKCKLVLKAYTNGRGHLHNPPFPRRLANIRSPKGKGDEWNYNNVGSIKKKFFNDLSPFGFKGKKVWSKQKFYEADAVARYFK